MKRLLIGGSYYKNLFASYLVILCIFILLSPLTYQYARKLTKDNELRFATSTVGYTKERFDKEISSMKEMAYILLDAQKEYNRKYYNNSVLNDMSIVSKIGNVVGTVDTLENCYIIDNKGRNLYSIDGSESYRKLYKYEPMAGGDITSVLSDGDGFFYIPVKSSDGIARILLVAGNSFENNDIQVLMPLRDDWIKSIYRSDYRIGVFMIVDKNGTVISSSDISRIHTNVDGEIYKNLSNDSTSFFAGEKWMAFEKSDECEWYYVVETDKSLINQTANKIRIMYFCVMIATLLLGLVFTVISSRWVYLPIDRLVSRFSQGEKESELEAIEDSFLKLSRENEKYRREANYLQLFDRSEDDGIEKIFENETLCGIVIKGFNAARYLKEISSREYGTDSDRYRFFSVGENEIIGLFCGKENTAKLTDAMQAVHDGICKKHGVSLMIGIGNFLNGSDGFSFSLNNARYALEYGSGEGNVFVFDENMSVSCSIVIDKDYTERRLLQAVEKGSLSEIEETISKIFADNADIPNVFKFGLSIILVNIYSTVGRKTDSHVIDYELLMRELKNEYDSELLMRFFIQLFNGMLLEDEESDKDEPKKEILEGFIKENYSDVSFDLGVLADKMGYSTIYMTSLFKKIMGESFMQYLLDYRIEKAKELLVTTDKKIEQISYEVGFGTYNNFARAFRKKTGTSPGDYRKKEKTGY